MADKVEKRILTLYSDVQATSVHWLWYPFIAVGKITLLQGDPGDGKSTMMIAVRRSWDVCSGIPVHLQVFWQMSAIVVMYWQERPLHRTF